MIKFELDIDRGVLAPLYFRCLLMVVVVGGEIPECQVCRSVVEALQACVQLYSI